MSEFNLPDPTPDKEHDRKAVEASLSEMAANESAEIESIARQVENDESMDQIIEDMGGHDEVARIIGEPAAEELRDIANDQHIKQAEQREQDAQAASLEMELQGASAQEIIDRFGGIEEYERLTGTRWAHSYNDSEKEEK